jgi:hypothetical protein
MSAFRPSRLLLKLGAPSHIFSLRNGGKAEMSKSNETKIRQDPATTLCVVTVWAAPSFILSPERSAREL